MSLKFQTYLSKFRIDKGNKNYTHVGLGSPMGAFNIPDENMDEFYEKYVDSIMENMHPCLGEKHQEISPILIDFDFKFPDEEKYLEKNNITEEEIRKICNLYISYIKYYLKINEEIRTYIFLKPKPVRGKECVKNGLHIQFPDIWTTADVQYVIRRRILEDIPAILGKDKYINNYHDIIDESIIERNCWLLYGSRKPNQEPYQLKYIYEGNDLKEINIKLKKNKLIEIVKYLSIRQPREPVEFRNKIIEQEAINFYENHILNIKDVKIKQIKSKRKLQFTYEEIEQLVGLLDEDRAESYTTWIELGWCLHNISIDLLDIWEDFSRKSSKYTKGECEKIWDDMRDEGLYIGTLIMWAKTDNPEGYRQWEKRDISRLILNSINNFTHTAIAEILFRKYGHEFVCASQKYKLWYRFENHRWVETDEGVDLRSKISTELVKDYLGLFEIYSMSDLDKLTADYRKKKPQATKHNASLGIACSCQKCIDQKNMLFENLGLDNDVVEQINSATIQTQEKYLFDKTAEDFIKELTKKLQTTKFKNDVMTECREIFYDRYFLNNIDSHECNENLYCCKNGVYNLKTGVFREGRPEDYISLSTNVEYHVFSENDLVYIEVMNFLRTVFPEVNVFEFVMKLLSTYTQGTNPEEKFYIFTGTGANGKSKIIELFRLSNGEYCKTFPVELLTQKKGKSGTASPDVADGKGKRFCTFQEPGPDEKIQVGLMKEYSGGDIISCRPLFKPPMEFKPRWKLLLTCNDLPSIPSTDDGTWRRLRVVEFKSKFVEQQDLNKYPDNPYVFLRDKDLTSKLRKWKECFLYILLKYYKKYQEEGLIEPEDVIKYTKQYEEKCDAYAQFLNECFVVDHDANTPEIEVYNSFKDWFVYLYDMKPPTKVDFRNYIMSKRKNLFIKKGKDMYYKLKLIQEEKDYSDDED